MNELVRIKTDEFGAETSDADVWHLVNPAGWQGKSALCSGQYFGIGESDVEFETKEVQRGGITCPRCLKAIMKYKAVRL